MVREFILLLSFVNLSLSLVYSQKNGLVLSGGGGPGIAHIGVLKALEENDIPIDYITSTSIGSIVGGMYASGMSPDEMITFFKSDDFKSWESGTLSHANHHYYFKQALNPAFIHLKFNVGNNNSVLTLPALPTYIIAPHLMNLGLNSLFSKVSIYANTNFDRLFVPFRCIASDVYHKKAVVFSNGDLANSIRASMTFPFAFKPLEIDGNLMFDGGIYNNFPADVMQEVFNPDYIIGSVVAYNPPKADKNDVLMQLQNMIIHETDYTLPDSVGVVFNFDLKHYDTFDFSKVDELVQIGYDSVIANLDKIKKKVIARTAFKDLKERRKDFKLSIAAANFTNVEFEGLNEQEVMYVRSILNLEGKELNIKSLNDSYLKLISTELFSEIIPTVKSVNGEIKLNLKFEKCDPFKLSVGGNLSTILSNQTYFKLNYQEITTVGSQSNIEFQLGENYKGVSGNTQTDFFTKGKRRLNVSVVLHQFDFSRNNSFNFYQNEIYSRVSLSKAVFKKAQVEIGLAYGLLIDNYSTVGLTDTKRLYNVGKGFIKLEDNTLNCAMFPTRGSNYSTSLQYFNGVTSYLPLRSTDLNQSKVNENWIQFKSVFNRYFQLIPAFSLGLYGEMGFSNRMFQNNYIETLLQTPRFEPTPFLRSNLIAAFCADKYGAIGIQPIIAINRHLHFRTDAFLYLPYQSVLPDLNTMAYYSKPFKYKSFIVESALVYKFKSVSASFYTNYSNSKFNIGLNFGVLLFKPRFVFE